MRTILMKNNRNKTSEQGVALITAMLILLLLSSLIAAFIMLVMTDQGVNGIDRDQTQAFYAAYAGMEQMTANLGTLFNANYAASAAQVNAIAAAPPVLPGIAFIDPKTGGSGYQINFPVNAQGFPAAANTTISKGPYQGFIGLLTPYTMTVIARSLTGSEVKLTRTLETVAIPVFQFGMFSQTDLSFFPGPVFSFGGRVHTNGNLWLAGGSTLTLSDKTSAVGEVIRTNLSNGWPTSVNYTGTVDITTAPGTGLTRSLGMGEGSLVGNLGSALNEPTWTNNSLGAYNHNLLNGRTGARTLNLAVTTFGATPIEVIRMPVVNENATNPQLLGERYFTQASLRIMLADTAAELTAMPTVCGVPRPLSGGPPAAGLPPFASSSGNATDGYWTALGTPTIGGFILVEMQNNGGNCVDVTQEFLNLGFTGNNISNGAVGGAYNKLVPVPGNACPAQANPNSIIRVQRVRDNPTAPYQPCGFNAVGTISPNGFDYWPNVLFDTREGTLRDVVPAAPNTTKMMNAGVMNYTELDINNLCRWFTGAIGASGAGAINITGYTVYFSDRRNNAVDPVLAHKNGEFGWEDFVNPASATGAPNNNLDPGEDLDGTGNLVMYGGLPPAAPSIAGVTLAAAAGAGALPLADPRPTAASKPADYISIPEARVNPPLFFRRALKLVNGQTINLGNCSGGAVVCGLTVVAENPVYVQGSYNAPGNTFGVAPGTHVAAAVLADAFTFLSINWNDIISFTQPYNQAGRNAATSWYRLAIVAGKGISFPQPAGTAQDFGTDGGVHNFLRYLENWGGQTLNYRGSIVSFYSNRQAVGTFKCCTTVYSPPTRGYNFDVDFLTPILLPPKTPMFRDVDITGFSQLIMPNQ
jgi:hypothetical protein